MTEEINNKKPTIERKKKQIEIQKMTRVKKLRFMRLVFILMLFILAGVIIYEKLAFGDSFERRAIEQQIAKSNVDVIINPNRGSILDRYKHSLAISRTVYNVVLDARTLSEVDSDEVAKKEKEKDLKKKNEPTIKHTVIERLSTILEIDKETLYEYLNENDYGKTLDYTFGVRLNTPKRLTKYQIIAKSVEKEVADILKEKKIPYVHLEEDTKRSYTNNNLASQLIGFMRADVKWGLESEYDSYLAGVEGRSFVRYNDFDTASKEIISAEQGKTLITTIDLKIQQFADGIVNKIGEEYNPVNASIIAMNPTTGEILAWSQYPNYDLNEPSNVEKINNKLVKANWDFYSETEQLSKLNSMWTDFNATSTFEPGSIYKPVVVAAALEEGVISLNDKFSCGGVKYFGSLPIPCWNTHGHGSQTVSQVLANSCNVGMMEIIQKLGYEKYYKYQHDFGFGEKTGIDLPNEQSVSYWVNTIKQLKNPINLATNSMGQGFNSTAIQALNAFAATINGGNLMQPYLVSQIIDKNNVVLKENQPTIVRKVVSKQVSDFLRTELEKVVSKSGTGSAASIKGYNIGGKTGTAQQFKREDELYAQSFVGYLTTENPEIIALAVIYLPEDHTKTNTTPAIMIREFFLEIIKYKGIQPTGEVSEDDSINVSDESITIEDYVGLDLVTVSKSLNSYGFDFEFVGSSGTKVKSQIPAAGTKISKRSKIYIYITNDEGNKNVSVIPDVTGLTLEEAEKFIKESNLTNVVVESYYDEDIGVAPLEGSTSVPDNITDGTYVEKTEVVKEIVVNQMPSPKIEVSEGTEIKLKVRKVAQ